MRERSSWLAVGMALALASAAARSPCAAAEEESKSPQARWIVAGEEVARGDVLAAWLVVPPPEAWPGAQEGTPAAAARTVRASLLLPPGGEAFFPAQDECSADAATGSRQRSWSALPGREQVVPVCVRAGERRDIRLVAVLEFGEPAARSQVIESPIVKVPGGWRPGTEGVAVVVGLVVGIVSTAAQKWVERWLASKKAHAELRKIVAASLVPEATANRRLLEPFLSGQLAAPPVLQVGGYVAVLGDQGIAGFLGAGERAAYFRRLQRLYRRINEYNSLVNRLAAEPELRRRIERLARAIQARLDGR